MKKLALVLGSLLVVGAVASAKEVVPAPVAAPEVVERIVEKPVIVYRDREVTPAWRPNGSIDVNYKSMFDTEGHDARDEKGWAGDTFYGRLQTTAKVNFTENQRLEIRSRNYSALRGKSSSYEKGVESDELRFRYFYNNGKIFGDVNGRTRVQYRQKAHNGAKDIGVRYELDFANYLFNNDFIKTDYFRLAPRYTYAWNGEGGAEHNTDYTNTLGLDFESYFTLPYGFALEFNLYPQYAFASDKYDTTKGMKDKEFKMNAELYLYQVTNLFKSGRHSIDFLFEGGYDPYSFRQFRTVKDRGTPNEVVGQRRKYELYAQPSVQYNFQATDYLKTYLQAGAEYRNWVVTNESEAKNWRWQPFVTVGASVNF